VLAKSLSDRVALFISKLKLSPDKAIPLSLLNFRSELASGNSDKNEHQLTLLLESRLAAVPEYVVLERRHADVLGFERSVLTPTPPEVLKGAYLIDGSFRPAGIDADGEIVVSLRVRSPKTGMQSTLDLKGSAKDPLALVNAMADKIGHEIGSTGSSAQWQPLDEAKEYMREARWAWEHSTDKATLEALNSAELLGDNDRDLRGLRIDVLCEMSKPQSEHRPGLDTAPPPLEERVELIRRAMRELIERHAMENPPILAPPGQDPPDHWGGVDYVVIGRARELLNDLDASPLTKLTDSFRQELRIFVNFDPLHGKVPVSRPAEAENINPPDNLANSAEEEMAFFHHRLTNDHVFVFVFPADFCSRFYKNPADRQAAYEKFMQNLKADPNGRLPWLIISCLNGDAATRDALYPQFLQELWDQREELFKTVAFRQYIKAGAQINADVRKKYISQTLPLFHYCLSRLDRVAVWEATGFMPLEWYSPEEIDGIWKDLQIQKALLAQGTNVEGRHDLELFETDFLKRFPSKRKSAPDDVLPRLTIDRFWCAKDLDVPNADPDVTVGQAAPRAYISQFSSSPDGKSVWGLMWRHGPGDKTSGIFEVRLPDMASKLIDTDCGRPIHAARTPKAYYVTYADYGGDVKPVRPDEYYLKRYDLQSHTWTQRRETGVSATGDIEALDDQIYLSLTAIWRNGLMKYDWDTDKVTILASSRRKPAQNQFDDRGDYDLSLFVGPGNKPCVVGPGGIYYIQEEPGPWSKWPFDLAGGNVVNAGKLSLITNLGGEVVLIDPDKPAPIPLMAPTEPVEWRSVLGSNVKKKELPSWAAQAVWKYRPEWGDLEGGRIYVGASPAVNYHEDHLYILLSPRLQRKGYELLVFNPGQPDPVFIPLRFLFKGSEETADKILRWDGNVYVPYDGYNLVSVEQGICLQNNWCFWFVPYADIEAYVRANSN
jgi:hypothetical protein